MSIILATLDVFSDGVGLVLVLSLGLFCAAILPSAWRGHE